MKRHAKGRLYDRKCGKKHTLRALRYKALMTVSRSVWRTWPWVKRKHWLQQRKHWRSLHAWITQGEPMPFRMGRPRADGTSIYDELRADYLAAVARGEDLFASLDRDEPAAPMKPTKPRKPRKPRKDPPA